MAPVGLVFAWLLERVTQTLGMFLREVDRKFQDGEIIFKEGDRGHSAFVIVSGQVEILKKTAKGSVRLAIISPGEVFGEMGVINKSKRNVTARANGNVVVEVVKQPVSLVPSQNYPEFEPDVTQIAKSLRQSNHMLIPPLSSNRLIDGSIKLNIWNLIGDLIAKRRNKNRFLEVRIVPMPGDEGGSNAQRILGILKNESEFRVAILSDELLDEETAGMGHNLKYISSFGQQLLQREKADLLIFGEVNTISTVLQLRFLCKKTEADQPGSFLATDRLSLPRNFSPEYGKLLIAVVVAAIVPKSETYRLMIHPLLINALEAAQEAGNEPPVELPLVDQASIQICYGHVVAKIGNLLGDSNRYQKAAIAYQGAIVNISKETDQVEWANLQYHLGYILHELGDRNRDNELLENALESYYEAMTFFTREDFPWEWGLLQIRIGNILYRLDTINNDTETLKKAVTAYQSSLKVINRMGTPIKWSEVKNSLGQVLQVWGDAAKNTELLELAVKCCQEALQVRSREETPLPWAITQNNMGSALFLLGRQTDSLEILENSTAAFSRALSIYHAYGYPRLRKVTERNLMKVERLLNKMKSRRTAKVDWEDESSGISSNHENEKKSVILHYSN